MELAGTYSTHVWHVRDADTGELWLKYVGKDATIELLGPAANTAIIHKGYRPDILPPLTRPVPAEWGSYRQRGEAQSLPIMVRYLAPRYSDH